MKTRNWGLGIAFIIVIILSLFFVSPVLADSETPPEDTAVVETTVVPTDGAAATEVATEMTVAPTEVPTEEMTPAPTEEVTVEPTEDLTGVVATAEPTEDVTLQAPTEEPTEAPTEEAVTEEEMTEEEAMAAALADTDAVLLDDQGQPIPLASEEGSAVAEASDPYFMANGVYIGYTTTGTCAPVVLPANCHLVGSNAIAAAITAYTTTVGATGAIYIEAGTYNEISVNLVIDGATTPVPTGIIGAGSDTTIINLSNGYSLSVQNTTTGFTLLGVTVNGNVNSGSGTALVDFNNNTGTLTITDVAVINSNSNGDGLEVTNQTGAVNVNRLESSLNGDEGAKITATGNITIKNSSFDWNNGPVSLTVKSTAGSVTIDGVSASKNLAGSGVELYAKTGIKITNSIFSNNTSGYGIIVDVLSAGTITMDTVFANQNTYDNIHIENTNGAITLTNVEATNSGSGYGIYIDNCNASSGVCTSTVAGAVTMTGVTSKYNYFTNIYVAGAGAVTMTNMLAEQSYHGAGILVDNTDAKAASAVTITNATVTSESLQGISIYSRGNVTLNTITADYAGTVGIYVDNSSGVGTVTITKTQGRTSASICGAIGIQIISKGNVSITGVDASSNQTYGIKVENFYGSGNVTIADTNVRYTQVVASSTGIYVVSHGIVTMTNDVVESNNGSGVQINNSSASTPKTVTLTNCKIAWNSYDGLAVFSKGNITLTGVNAYYNAGTGHTWGGIVLDNTAGTASTITVTKSNSNSSYNGFLVYTNGNVTFDTVETNYNAYKGTEIWTTGGTGSVTIKNSSFLTNGNSGLEVYASGMITLNTVNASSNSTAGNYGAMLDNSGGTAGITITGSTNNWNYFNNNHSYGLYIHTKGTVNISCVEADSNGSRGVYIQNDGTGSVTITNLNASSNVTNGLYVIANGSITLTNPYVSGNSASDYGVYLNNSTGTGSVTVQGTSVSSPGAITANNDTATGSNLGIVTKGAVTVKYLNTYGAISGSIYIYNAAAAGSPVTLTSVTASGTTNGYGIYVESYGVVTISGVTANNNIGYGLEVLNYGATAKNVTISLSTVSSNTNDNIYVDSKGMVTISGVTANYSSTGYGVYINNTMGTGSIMITYSGSTLNEFSHNAKNGIHLSSRGAITINKTTTYTNHWDNISITNTSGSGTITLNTVTANSSDTGYGVAISTNSAIVITGITALNNAAAGVYLDNSGGTANVSVTNGTMDGNTGGEGLYILSNGFVTLTNVSANSNSSDGLYVDNVGGMGITLQNSGTAMNYFNYNSSLGVSLYSDGPLKVTNTSASGNTGAGIYIDNTTGTAGVTLTNVSGSASSSYAIEVLTNGVVTGTSLTGYGNSSYAAIYIDNCRLSGVCNGTGNVTLTGVTVQGGAPGLWVASNGTITVTNLNATFNGSGYGALLDNHFSATKAPVYVYSSVASYNGADGIHIQTLGSVVLDGVTAIGNSGSGANGVFIANNYAGATGDVSVLSTKGANNFSNNSTDGLYIVTNGNITLNNVTANYNYSNGIEAYTYGAGKFIKASNVTLKWNSYHGFLGTADADCTFTGIKAFNNGLATSSKDGINMNTNGHNFTLTNSYLTGNGQNGLDVTVGGTSHTVKVTASYFFGNDHYTASSTVKDILTDGTLQIS